MRPIFIAVLSVGAIIVSFLVGCSLGSARELSAEDFRRQFEVIASARSSQYIGASNTRAYAETVELVGLRTALGLDPEPELVWAPLSEFTVEEKNDLLAGKLPWSYTKRAR